MGNAVAKTANSIQSQPLETNADEQAAMGDQQSYWSMAKQGYQELVNAIIRPPRCIYEIKQLGPTQFSFCGKEFKRSDFELINTRGLKLRCSIWEPIAEYRQNPVLPCIIYMHGNSSARLEAIPQLSLTLSLGAAMLAFDFAGSGLSDGDYVSLGAFEKEDLKVCHPSSILKCYIFFRFLLLI
jgi:hypothetical protein